MRRCHVGLISGTSMDGIDAVVVDLNQNPPAILAAGTFPFNEQVQAQLDVLRADPDAYPIARLGELDSHLGQQLAETALAIIAEAGLKPTNIAAIGSHGQTVLHRVDANPPFTLQIGDPGLIADRTGITTVADFRRADVAAGGQGAPLAPLVHQALLASDEENRVVVNLGGIANLTRLHAGEPTLGFDTGPANCFLDFWYRRHHDGRFDHKGQWAATGQVDPTLLAQLLDDPYFRRPPPKSTGIEYFSERWLEARLPDWASDRPGDLQATLAEFTAVSLVDAMRPLNPDRVLLCGGGSHNSDLCRRIEARLGSCPAESTDSFGLPADHVESMLFAWLAAERIAGHPQPTSTITGARQPVFLGVVYEPARGQRN
ncbi:MAG: anhydro-N-acetylmuramic acid kinase [Pseudomonadota bacterium]